VCVVMVMVCFFLVYIHGILLCEIVYDLLSSPFLLLLFRFVINIKFVVYI